MEPSIVLLIGHARKVVGDTLQPKLPESEWKVLHASDDPEELAGQLKRAKVLCGGMGDTNQFLRDAGEPLRLLQVPFTGTDWLDEEAVPPGVSVCNVHNQDVGIAEYVLCQLLQWVCRVSEADANMRESCKVSAGRGDDAGFSPPMFQEPMPKGRPELFGRTLGIVGLGSIGRAVAARAAAFGMRVMATVGRTPAPPAEPPLDWIGSGTADLEQLLRESDFVLLACPLTDSTRGLVGAPQLAQMQQHAVLVNISRGPVVDEAALFGALQKQQIGGAILDVWWRFPDPAKRQKTCAPFGLEHPFHTLSNVVMSPHMSGWSEGRDERKLVQIAESLKRLADAKPLLNLVYSRPSASGA